MCVTFLSRCNLLSRNCFGSLSLRIAPGLDKQKKKTVFLAKYTQDENTPVLDKQKKTFLFLAEYKQNKNTPDSDNQKRNLFIFGTSFFCQDNTNTHIHTRGGGEGYI